MPTQLILKPFKILHVEHDQELIKLIRNVIYITPHWDLKHSSSLSVTANTENIILLIKIDLPDLGVTQEAIRLFTDFIKTRLQQFEIPCRLEQTACTRPPDTKVFFTRRSLRPPPSDNSLTLKKLNDTITVPKEFCCALSGNIMDCPVYDIRSVSVKYEKKDLLYLKNCFNPYILPTKNIFFEDLIRVDYALLAKINDFMQSRIDVYKKNQLSSSFHKFGIPVSDKSYLQDKKNRAFRSAAMYGTPPDLLFLLSMGAELNGKDPHQGKTALLFAATVKNMINILCLLDLKANVYPYDSQSKDFFDYCLPLNVEHVQQIIKKLVFLKIPVPTKLQDRLAEASPLSDDSAEDDNDEASSFPKIPELKLS